MGSNLCKAYSQSQIKLDKKQPRFQSMDNSFNSSKFGSSFPSILTNHSTKENITIKQLESLLQAIKSRCVYIKNIGGKLKVKIDDFLPINNHEFFYCKVYSYTGYYLLTTRFLKILQKKSRKLKKI